MVGSTARIVDLPPLRNRVHVFRDRVHAGEQLAGMLEGLGATESVVFGIAAGGVPVAAEVARRLALPLDIAVVSKITLPWNTEGGYGAVAFDGTVRLNTDLVGTAGLSPAEVERGITVTRQKVARRTARLRAHRRLPKLVDRRAVIIDDGLASGLTMLVAVEALRGMGAREIIVAVPTAHARSAERIAGSVTALYCANIRDTWGYAVADAYQQWSDVSEDTALRILDDWQHESNHETADRL